MTSKSFQTVYPNQAVDRVNRAVELLGRLRQGEILNESELGEIQTVLEERGREVVMQEKDGILESAF